MIRVTKESVNLLLVKDRRASLILFGLLFSIGGILLFLVPNISINRSPVWLDVVFVLIGALVIVISKSTTIQIDKSSGKILIKRSGLLGSTLNEFDLIKVKSIELELGYSAQAFGAYNYGYVFKLVFVLDNSERIPFGPQISATGLRIWFPEKKVGKKVADFLNVPFEERKPPTVRELTAAVAKGIEEGVKREIEKQPQ